MRLLLDTHILLWALREPERISQSASALVRDRANEIFVSAATPWEIATKYRIGKLPDAASILLAYPDYLSRLGATELPITSRHALAAGQLEWHHKDPFDRVLAAQSVLEGLALVTADVVFRSIAGVQVVWAD